MAWKMDLKEWSKNVYPDQLSVLQVRQDEILDKQVDRYVRGKMD